MFYKVLGYDRKNKEYYNLGYTYDKKKCLNYYIENGWKKQDIKFERS
jgi:hypothetical protein